MRAHRPVIGRGAAMRLIALVLGVGTLVLVALVVDAERSGRAGGGERAVERPPAGPGLPARPAASFVDAVGVNVHTSYVDTAYARRDEVRRALRDLGVRHVRDGTVPEVPQAVELHRELAADGIRTTFIVGDPGKRELDPLLDALAGPLRPAVAALEGPNELDGSDDPDWAPALRAWMERLAAGARARPALRGVPVLGPSFLDRDGRETFGELPAAVAVRNAHAYPVGAPPERGLAPELRAGLDGERPLVITETGYHTALSSGPDEQPPVSEAAQGVYAPRALLEAFRRGVRRTFLYELLEQRADPSFGEAELAFGLLREDLTPKPAFTAIRALLAGARPIAPLRGTTRPLPARLGGDRRALRSVVLQRAPDEWVVALWRAAPVWDEAARRPVADTPRPVTLALARPALVRVSRLGGGPAPDATQAVREAGADVGAEVVLVQVRVVG